MILKTAIAKLISTLGHPFLTVPVFVVFLLFSIEPTEQAIILSVLIIGGIFVPVGLKTIRGVRKGTYTNLDVSDRSQRQRWFIATTLLLLAVTVIIWVTGQARTLRVAVACALLLLIAAQAVNTRIKASMHLAFHVFLGMLILYLNSRAGAIFLLFTPFLAWSRIHLRRHVGSEVMVGVLLGIALGAVFWVIN